MSPGQWKRVAAEAGGSKVGELVSPQDAAQHHLRAAPRQEAGAYAQVGKAETMLQRWQHNNYLGT